MKDNRQKFAATNKKVQGNAKTLEDQAKIQRAKKSKVRAKTKAKKKMQQKQRKT